MKTMFAIICAVTMLSSCTSPSNTSVDTPNEVYQPEITVLTTDMFIWVVNAELYADFVHKGDTIIIVETLTSDDSHMMIHSLNKKLPENYYSPVENDSTWMDIIYTKATVLAINK